MRKIHLTTQRFLALMIGILFLSFFSCKKTPDTIGNNLLSENNYFDLFRCDTVEVLCHSYIDTIGTKNVTYALLGSMNDPVFGLTQAGFYTQFNPSTAGQNFGENPIVDSLVLQLCLSDYYGDTTVMQTAHVYELTDTISTFESYYCYSEVATDNIDQANAYHFYPHPKTNVHFIGTDTVAYPIIRIPLSQELGNYLISLDSSFFSEPDKFKEHFKGLYVTCDAVSQDGAICSINLTNNTFTLLQLYYHNAATPDKRMYYNFYVSSSDTYFNHFDHDYTQGNPQFVNQLINGDTLLGQETLYLQTMGGIRAHLRFPNLRHWADSLKDSHIVINEAKLVLPASPLSNESTCYKVPSAFVLVGFKEDGNTFLLPDYHEGTNYFGGTYSQKSNAVIFRISEYVQDLILNKNEEYNYGLSLGINGAAYNAHRYVINGPGAATDDKLRLEITYSIVNE